MSFFFHQPLSCLTTINTVTGGLTSHSLLWYSHCVTIMAAVLKHFEIPANTEGSVRSKFKHCTQVIADSTKVTSNFVKHLKVRISSLFTCHFC